MVLVRLLRRVATEHRQMQTKEYTKGTTVYTKNTLQAHSNKNSLKTEKIKSK